MDRLEDLYHGLFEHIAQAGELVAERYMSAALSGDAQAQYDLGEWYKWAPSLKGAGTMACYHWYKLAANQGHPGAMRRLDELLGHPSFRLGQADAEVPPADVQVAFRRQAGARGLPVDADTNIFDSASDAVFEAFLDVKQAERRRPAPEVGAVTPDLNHARPMGLDGMQEVLAQLEAAGYFPAAPPEVAGDVEELESAMRPVVGLTEPRDEERGYQRALDAAQRGNAGAMALVGYLALLGIGTARDEPMAAIWFHRAIGAGYTHAHFGLGLLHEVGRGAPRDWTRAVSHYQAAAMAERPEGSHLLAHADHREAHLGLARIYGAESGDRHQPALALAWLERLEEIAVPHFQVGFMHEIGVGGEPDAVRAIEHYIRGAQLFDYGYPDEHEREACFWIGRLFLLGRGVPPDTEAALGLFEVADRPLALFLAGALLADGDRVPRDPERALAFFRRASRLQVEEDAAHLAFLPYLPPGDRWPPLLKAMGDHLMVSAAHGYAPAQFELGWLHDQGLFQAAPDMAWRAAAEGQHLGAAAQSALWADERGEGLASYQAVAELAVRAIEAGPPPEDWELDLPRWLVHTEPSYMAARVTLKRLEGSLGLDLNDLEAMLRKRGYRGPWRF